MGTTVVKKASMNTNFLLLYKSGQIESALKAIFIEPEKVGGEVGLKVNEERATVEEVKT